MISRRDMLTATATGAMVTAAAFCSRQAVWRHHIFWPIRRACRPRWPPGLWKYHLSSRIIWMPTSEQDWRSP
jgi:hypothetical protein